MDLRKVSDQELLSNTKKLVAQEREVLMQVLHHLREIERRRLYSDLREPSLYSYCINVLRYSNAQADRRIKAMRMIKELPQIEDKIASGKLSLTNVAKAKELFNKEQRVAPLNIEEKLEVLQSLENKSTREAEKILLAQSSLPAPEVKERIRQVTVHTSEVKFGADDEFLTDMNRLRGRLAHKNPKMNTYELLREALKIALNATDPTKKISRNESKRESIKKESPAPEVKAGRRYITIKSKREVWARAQCKCEICGSEYALENDHRHPVALGGSCSADNLRLLCRNCNQREAIKKIGQETMDRYLI